MSQHLVCYSQFDRAMARLNLTARELCRQIGYSGDAHRQWGRKKEMPKVTALACSEAPTGHERWTLRLLADKVVELNYCEHISHTQVGQILQKMP